MVNDINPGVKAYYAYKTLDYLNGSAKDEGFSIAKSAKDAAGSLPIGIAFTQIPRTLSYRKVLGGASEVGILGEYAQIGKNVKNLGITRPASVGEFFKGISTKKGMANNLNNLSKTDDVVRVADDAIRAAKQAKEASKVASSASKEIAGEALEAVVKKPGPISRFFGPIKKPFSYLAKKIGAIPIGGKALSETAFAKLCKKGNAGFIAVFDGAMELFTQVIPAFKNGGVGEGMKQIGKSGVKVAASTAGFVVGEMAGKAIGAAIGTAIFPGVGTLIGGLLGGLAGGIFGSSVTTGITQKIIGKSYSEKAQETEKQTQAQQVSRDLGAMQQLQTLTLQSLQAKQQSGSALSKDEQELLEYYSKSNYSYYSPKIQPSFNMVA